MSSPSTVQNAPAAQISASKTKRRICCSFITIIIVWLVTATCATLCLVNVYQFADIIDNSQQVSDSDLKESATYLSAVLTDDTSATAGNYEVQYDDFTVATGSCKSSLRSKDVEALKHIDYYDVPHKYLTTVFTTSSPYVSNPPKLSADFDLKFTNTRSQDIYSYKYAIEVYPNMRNPTKKNDTCDPSSEISCNHGGLTDDYTCYQWPMPPYIDLVIKPNPSFTDFSFPTSYHQPIFREAPSFEDLVGKSTVVGGNSYFIQDPKSDYCGSFQYLPTDQLELHVTSWDDPCSHYLLDFDGSFGNDGTTLFVFGGIFCFLWLLDNFSIIFACKAKRRARRAGYVPTDTVPSFGSSLAANDPLIPQSSAYQPIQGDAGDSFYH
ncbi:hypothetical protein ADUPG1_000590 [Aduncisulcus paluster]|uniref:Uncharacterized protein n=1 Tax=Aduncisulcus paluster TaxID=2918883 RepID=A0ABQ5K703_9EUKA|nr:hypothetical protein ADUPG1_000590 [Aduncisulcus paluster]